METKTRRAEYAEATRRALIDAAREIFAARGYGEASLEDVVARARVTRGALYHHFASKAELFAAVVTELQQEAIGKVMQAAATTDDPWESVVRGTEAFLDASLDRDYQRIVLLEAPSVIGEKTWRDIDAKCALGPTQRGLAAAMDAGAIERQPVGPLSYMLIGALHEGALYIARAENRRSAREEVGATTRRFLDSLRREARQ